MTIERLNLDASVDWLAERQNYIGASEVAIVVGESTYGSLAQLYAQKKGLRPPQQDNEMLQGGRWGEASVFEALAEKRPEWEVARAKVHVRDTKRRLACTPDGFAKVPDRDDVGVVQAKWVARHAFRNRWLDDPSDSIEHGPATPPAHYRLQVIAEMMLNQTSWGTLAVLVHSEFQGMKLRLFDIDRDPLIEDRILHGVETFWRDYFDANIMPAFEPQRDAELIRALYPRDDGKEIDLTGDNRALALVEDLIQVQAGLKRLEKDEAAIKTELCTKLGDATYGRLADGRRISWRQQDRKAYAVAAKSFRVFRVLPPAKEGKE